MFNREIEFKEQKLKLIDKMVLKHGLEDAQQHFIKSYKYLLGKSPVLPKLVKAVMCPKLQRSICAKYSQCNCVNRKILS